MKSMFTKNDATPPGHLSPKKPRVKGECRMSISNIGFYGTWADVCKMFAIAHENSAIFAPPQYCHRTKFYMRNKRDRCTEVTKKSNFLGIGSYLSTGLNLRHYKASMPVFRECLTRSASSAALALFHCSIVPTRYPVMRRILSKGTCSNS